jgi:hypothetical protein
MYILEFHNIVLFRSLIYSTGKFEALKMKIKINCNNKQPSE